MTFLGLLAACIMALSLTVFTANKAFDWVLSDWHTLRLQDKLALWASGKKKFTTAEWESARQNLESAEQLKPHDAALQDLLGMLYALQGHSVWDDEAARDQAYQHALEHQQKSLDLRANVAQNWANVALTKYLLGYPTEDLMGEWRKALQLGPYEQEIRVILLNVAFGRWSDVPPDVRSWVQTLHNDPELQEWIEAWAKYYNAEL